MDRKEKIELAIKKGYTCDPINGKLYGTTGGEISRNHNGYIRLCFRNGDSKLYILAHQFIWYWVNKEVVDVIDHINGIKNDNRISNLRSVTKQQNDFNRKNVKGYYWNKRDKKWQSKIKVNQKVICLGYYDNETDAHNAYLDAKKIYHNIS